MNQILIATHSTLAQGFYEAIKFFNADLPHVHFINAYVETHAFEEEFLRQVQCYKDENLIVFTDIMGGSVNQIAARHMLEFGYHLVSGTNLAVLLETVFQTEPITSVQLCQIVDGAKQQLSYVNMELLTNDDEEE